MNKRLITQEEKNNILKMLPFNTACEAMVSLPYKQGSIVELENGDIIKVIDINSLFRKEIDIFTWEVPVYIIGGMIGSFSNSFGKFILSDYRTVFNINDIKYVIIK